MSKSLQYLDRPTRLPSGVLFRLAPVLGAREPCFRNRNISSHHDVPSSLEIKAIVAHSYLHNPEEVVLPASPWCSKLKTS
jgi:hypothetical protein